MDYLRWKEFRATRQAVLRGERVHDLLDEDLKAQGYLPAGLFRVLGVGLTLTPTVLILRSLEVLGPVSARTSMDRGDALLSSNAADAVVILVALAIQIALLVAIPVVAWAGLRPGDRSKQNIRRGQRAILYHDGAHALLSDTAGYLCLSVVLW